MMTDLSIAFDVDDSAALCLLSVAIDVLTTVLSHGTRCIRSGSVPPLSPYHSQTRLGCLVIVGDVNKTEWTLTKNRSETLTMKI